MPKVRQIQQRFTSGEVDPAMLARSDVDQYYSAAETMTDVVTIPQGGFKRRGGLANRAPIMKQITRETAYTVTAPNGGTTGNLTDNDIATLFTTTVAIGTTNPYVVAQLDLGSAKAIGKIEVRSLSLSSGTSSEFFVQTSNDAAAWTTRGAALTVGATAKDYTRRAHVSARYIRLVRIGSTNLAGVMVTVKDMQAWIEGAKSKVRFRAFLFNNTQTYQFIFTDKNIAVYRNKQYVIDIRFEALASDNVPYVYLANRGDTAIIFNKNVQTQTMVRGADNDLWTLTALTWDKVPFFNFVPNNSAPATTLTPSASTGNITLTAGVATFTAADVDQYIEGNGGRARIVAFTSTTVVKAAIVIPFIDVSAMASGSWFIQRGYEAAWSSTRGWPAKGSFHEGRLVVGGSRDRPTTLWLSRINNYFNYDLGQLLDDDAIEFTIDGDYNEIVNVYSGRALMVFTTAAEYVVLQQFGDPITPANMNLRRQTSVGSEVDLPLAEFEGGVLYTQRGGQSIQEFANEEGQDTIFGNKFVSLLSSQLVKKPVDFALRKATSTNEGAYLLLVRNDGNATIGNILRSQNITAFCRMTTDGTFIACGVEDTAIWFAVNRVINGDDRDWAETLEDDNILDASVRLTSGLPTGTMSGLDHLEGESVNIIMDGSIVQKAVTVTGGAVTLTRNPTTSIEVGLPFYPVVKDLPVEIPQIGTAMGLKFNLSDIVLRLKDTGNIVVNGKSPPFRGFGPSGGGSPMDMAPPLFTGIKKMVGFKGYDLTGQVTITQNETLPMTVLAITKRVRAS